MSNYVHTLCFYPPSSLSLPHPRILLGSLPPCLPGSHLTQPFAQMLHKPLNVAQSVIIPKPLHWHNPSAQIKGHRPPTRDPRLAVHRRSCTDASARRKKRAGARAGALARVRASALCAAAIGRRLRARARSGAPPGTSGLPSTSWRTWGGRSDLAGCPRCVACSPA